MPASTVAQVQVAGKRQPTSAAHPAGWLGVSLYRLQRTAHPVRRLIQRDVLAAH